MPTPAEIQRTIEQYLTYRSARRGVTEISFYGGNFLGLSTDAIRELLCLAAANVSCGRADGIRFSTRPDTIDPDRLALIASYPVTTIELGAQSMHDATLRLTRRGHGAADTLSAIALLRRAAATPWGCR